MPVIQSVRNTEELRRVRALPRRGAYSNGTLEGVDLVGQLTELLRTPNGTQTLRPVQALALHDIAVCGGLFGSIGLGEGKTLILLLAVEVLRMMGRTKADRPLLLLPAGLIEKTLRDIDQYSKHWRIPNNIRLYSYDMLGKVQAAHMLEGDAASYDPDVVCGDEAHRLKNHAAACTRRVGRFAKSHPEVPFVLLSGTFMSKSLLELGHLVRWCLRGNAPVPSTRDELSTWAAALDVEADDNIFAPDPGALVALSKDYVPGVYTRTEARRAFRERLTETPGVVATAGEGERVDASIHIKAITYKQRPETDELWQKVRLAKAPADDFDLLSGAEVWKHAKALALGLTYVWSPRPPDEWRNPRREWGAFIRKTLSRSRTLDSPEQVEQAVLAGQLEDDGALQRWLAVKDTYEPNVEPRWHDDKALQVVIDWGKRPGLVWVEHTFFAHRLVELTGWDYFGEQGTNAAGMLADDAPTDKPIILSMDANREGRNLQHWSRNLVVSIRESAGLMHQLMGRTHRPGQREDEVMFDVLLGCVEHDRALRTCLARAKAIRDTTGQESKLLQADIEWPTEYEVSGFQGARWGN